jgi:gas vesicle protein
MQQEFKERATWTGSGFVMGMFCGMCMGAAAALLLAPRPGKELREQMTASVKGASQRAKDTYSRASETVTHVASRAATIADDWADRAKHLTARLNSTATMSQPS